MAKIQFIIDRIFKSVRIIECSLLPITQTKFAKVMFLHVSVCPQGAGIPACIAGFCPGGVPRPIPGGKLRGLAWGGSPGPHPGVSQHALRQTLPQQTATAAGGTHPTGMHSCFTI